MIYDSIELVVADLTSHFNADLLAIATAKGLQAAIDCTATIYKNMPSDVFAEISPSPGQTNLPGIGVYPVPRAQTSAKNQGIRYTLLRIAFEYFARGPDAALLLTQAELAVEAIQREVDRMGGLNTGGGNAAGIIGGGEDRGSVSIDIAPGVRAAGMDTYEQNALVIVPATVRDVGL